MEEASLTPELDTRASTESKPETQASKRRKMIQKTVVTVKIEANGGKQKNEGPPSDLWSWRKYGQKPIKGSPYPRGYYRCSTSKGCSAKKQVERCRTDASLLLITYTSSHNHPDPDPQNTTNQMLIQQHPKEPQTTPIEETPTTPNQEQQQEQEEVEEEEEPSPPQPSNNMASDEKTDHFHYLQSSSKDMIIINQEGNPFTVGHLEEENSHELLGLVFDEEPISYPHLMTFSTPTKSEENDFFDELEELPTSSSFNSFMRSSLFDERVILQPS